MLPILGQKEQIFYIFSELRHFHVVRSANQKLKVDLRSIILDASSSLLFVGFLREFGCSALIKDVILDDLGRIVLFRQRTCILVGQLRIVIQLLDLFTVCLLFLGLLANDVCDRLV